MINGVNELVMMKSDVLSGLEEVKVCTGYDVDGTVTEQILFEIGHANISPVYQSFSGWDEDLTKMRQFNELPSSFQAYCKSVSDSVHCPISIISVGPDREETIRC
jgi:adenylosuccinate synthase